MGWCAGSCWAASLPQLALCSNAMLRTQPIPVASRPSSSARPLASAAAAQGSCDTGQLRRAALGSTHLDPGCSRGESRATQGQSSPLPRGTRRRRRPVCAQCTCRRRAGSRWTGGDKNAASRGVSGQTAVRNRAGGQRACCLLRQQPTHSREGRPPRRQPCVHACLPAPPHY
jgi:hypothetical protein